MQDGKSDCLDGKETSPVDTGKGNGWRSFSGSDCAFDLCVYSRDDSVDSQSFGAVFCGKWFFLDFGREERSDFLGTETFWCFQLLAAKSLYQESGKVRKELALGDIEKARFWVSRIVGRDTENLDKQGIARAAVETVAENTSDGVIAPLLFMVLFGALGGFFYKAVNTMDSMVGYKNERYRLLDGRRRNWMISAIFCRPGSADVCFVQPQDG